MKSESPFLISVTELMRGRLEYDVRIPAQALDIQIEEVRFTEPVTGWISWQWVDKRAVATGRIRTRARMTCSRCLEDAGVSLDAEIRLTYSDEPVVASDRFEDGPDDEGVSHYTGDVIDAREEIREILLVEIPDVPLCGPQCKGLCPQCGSDLNHGPCRCASAPASDAEAAATPWQRQLRQLRGQIRG